MYIVPIKTESGDTFILGPWPEAPTHAQVVKVFRSICPDEADYCEELGYMYTSYELDGSEGPSGIGLESTSGHRCLKG